MARGEASNGKRGGVKILFLGQCLQYGYQGVDKSSTYVSLAHARLSERFPDLAIKLDLKHLNHPKGLKAILKHRLMFARPDIIVISTPALFAATHWRVNMIYEIAPEVIDTARSFLQKIDAKINGEYGPQATEKLLNKMSAIHPPLALDEYEALVREGVEMCRAGGCRAVLFGPGRFNEDTIENFALMSPQIWSSTNEMIRRLGKAFNVPVINAHDALGEYGGEVFLPQNLRFSRYGHEVVAREVEDVLASQIMALRTVQI